MPTCLPACLLTPPPLAPVRTIAWSRPLVWLSRALQDISNAPLISLAHGLALILIGAAILTLGHNRFWLMAGALSGFLVVAPVLATSLYALSRALERGEAANLGVVLKTWLNWQNSHVNKWGNDYWCMLQFGALLALGAVFQQIGMLYTTVTNAGFLTALYVPLVPLLSWGLLRLRPHWSTWPTARRCLRCSRASMRSCISAASRPSRAGSASPRPTSTVR